MALVLLLLSWCGIVIDEGQFLEFLGAVGQIVAFITLIWNQFARKDVQGFLWKTPKDD